MRSPITALMLAVIAGTSPTQALPTRPVPLTAVSRPDGVDRSLLLVGMGRTRPARGATGASLARVEALADVSGWGWRDAGITLRLGYHPQACCHWGVYDTATRTAWVGPSAFASPDRLRYTVLHELGHAWQFNSGQVGRLASDLARFGRTGTAGLEAGADCVATAWGAPARSGHYWSCPPAARALVTRRLAGDWR